MILYLVRHGIAADAMEGQRDESRPLTKEGIRKFCKEAAGLADLPDPISHVLASPLVRAMQTAELLKETVGGKKNKIRLQVDEALSPPGNLAVLLSNLRKFPKNANVAAVGHEPVLSGWIGELCFGKAGRASMKKGAVAAIEMVGASKGELLWLMQPRQLRATGGN